MTQGSAFWLHKRNWESVYLRLHYAVLTLWSMKFNSGSKPYDTICMDQAIVTSSPDRSQRSVIRIKLNQLKDSVLTFAFCNEKESSAWYSALKSASGAELAHDYIRSKS